MLKEESRRLLDDISKARLVEVPRDLSSYLRRKVREYLNESRAGWLWDKEKAKKMLTMLSNDFKPLMCSGRAADMLKSLK